MGKKHQPKADNLLAQNKKARHDYNILETYEAGIALTGTEIKSVRAGKVTLRDGFARVRNNEAWLENVHISRTRKATSSTKTRCATASSCCTSEKSRSSWPPPCSRATPSCRCACTSSTLRQGAHRRGRREKELRQTRNVEAQGSTARHPTRLEGPLLTRSGAVFL